MVEIKALENQPKDTAELGMVCMNDNSSMLKFARLHNKFSRLKCVRSYCASIEKKAQIRMKELLFFPILLIPSNGTSLIPFGKTHIYLPYSNYTMDWVK